MLCGEGIVEDKFVWDEWDSCRDMYENFIEHRDKNGLGYEEDNPIVVSFTLVSS